MTKNEKIIDLVLRKIDKLYIEGKNIDKAKIAFSIDGYLIAKKEDEGSVHFEIKNNKSSSTQTYLGIEYSVYTEQKENFVMINQ